MVTSRGFTALEGVAEPDAFVRGGLADALSNFWIMP
jgi:hypothetical protein